MTNDSVIYLPIDQLKFDPENPRLPSSVQKEYTNKKSDDVILKWMLEDATIIELMMSIGEKGYFQGELLLVIPDPIDTEKYIVIEGNRRLTAVKLLDNPASAPIKKNSVLQASQEANYRPEKLPVLIFSERNDILYYLGYRHITGIKTWGALAKAKYLKQLFKSLEGENIREKYRVLAKTIGSRTDTVERNLRGLAVYEKIVEQDFFGIKNLNEDVIDFSILSTALGYQSISDFLNVGKHQGHYIEEINLSHLQELTSWVFEKNSEGITRLGQVRNLQDLNQVIGNERALAAFRGGQSLSSSVLYTEKPADIFRATVSEAKEKLIVARDYIHHIEQFLQHDSEQLLEIQKLARNLKILVDEKLLED